MRAASRAALTDRRADSVRPSPARALAAGDEGPVRPPRRVARKNRPRQRAPQNRVPARAVAFKGSSHCWHCIPSLYGPDRRPKHLSKKRSVRAALREPIAGVGNANACQTRAAAGGARSVSPPGDRPCASGSHNSLQRCRFDDAEHALGFRASRCRLKRFARSGERERQAACERARLRGSPSTDPSSAGLNARPRWRLRRALPLAARERGRNARAAAQAHAPLPAGGRRSHFIAEWPGQRSVCRGLSSPRSARLRSHEAPRWRFCAAHEQVIANGSANGRRRSRSDGNDRFRGM